MARKLRIAATVFFGVLTVALCVLWMLSIWRVVTVSGKLPGRYDFSIQALHGGGSLHTHPTNSPWVVKLSEGDMAQTADGFFVDHPYTFFHREMRTDGWSFHSPIWLPSILCAVAAIACWHPKVGRRFSLRSLLFATTLVAVVLGLCVWLAS